jgi:hypothetical protein
MTTEIATTSRQSRFTRAERRALQALHTRYQEDAGLFSRQERAQLLFLRWLVQTGRLSETRWSSPTRGREVAPVAR